jgi:hypothetical protein
MGYERRQTAIGAALALAVCAIVVFFFLWVAPVMVHPFVMTIWKHWPGWTMFGLIIAGVILIVTDRSGIGALLLVVFIPLWIIGVIYSDWWKKESYLANISIEQLSDEPDTTGYRFLPLEVVKTTATNKTSDSQVTPGKPWPLIEGDTASWIVPEEPNNFSMEYNGKQPGYLTINTTADTARDTTGFAPGFGLCCFNGRSLGWTNINQHFWADYYPNDAYMTKLPGTKEAVIVQPYDTYYLDWSHWLPVMVPQFGGVLIYHADGTSEDLTPQEAASKYPGGQFFPEELAKYFAYSYQLKDGIWNYLFTHKDLPDIPTLGSSSDKNSNEFPFLIPTDDGAKWYTAVEPYGASKSAYMAYYIDATTGKVQIYKFTEPLVGADRAETFVNNAFNTLKSTYFYEPRPMVKGGNLYWMLSATASGAPDVQFTALVDAYSEDVIKLDNQQAVQRVVNGEDPHKVGTVVSSSGSTTQSSSGEATTPTSTASGLSSESNEQLAQELREAADRLEKAGK